LRAFGLYTLSAAGSFRSLPFAKAAVFSTIALTIGVLYLVGAWSLFKDG